MDIFEPLPRILDAQNHVDKGASKRFNKAIPIVRNERDSHLQALAGRLMMRDLHRFRRHRQVVQFRHLRRHCSRIFHSRQETQG